MYRRLLLNNIFWLFALSFASAQNRNIQFPDSLKKSTRYYSPDIKITTAPEVIRILAANESFNDPDTVNYFGLEMNSELTKCCYHEHRNPHDNLKVPVDTSQLFD